MGSLRFFKMHLRVPFLLLALLEFVVCVVAVHIALYVRFDGPQTPEEMAFYTIESPVLTSLMFGIVMPVTMMAMGLYQSRFRGGVIGVFLRSISGFIAGGIILAIIYYIVPQLYLGRGVFGIAVLLSLIHI